MKIMMKSSQPLLCEKGFLTPMAKFVTGDLGFLAEDDDDASGEFGIGNEGISPSFALC